MKTRYGIVVLISVLVGLGTAGGAQAAPPAPSPSPTAPVVSFEAGDSPGNFFTCVNTANSKSLGCVNATAGQKSLAVIAPGEAVGFPTYSAEASTVHTALSLIYPTGSKNMPFKTAIDVRDPARRGVATVTLRDPGLYVFICDIHPYMFSAVIVDDPKTKVNGGLGLDLGKKISLVNGITVPTYSDLAIRLLRTFFILTDPTNWKDYTKNSWTPAFPAVPVIVYDVNGNRIDVADLSAVLGIGTVDLTVPANKLFNPTTAAVGEIWVDTQFELTAGKSKPGTATAIKGSDWTLTKKIALPRTNMNHPHNMWTDKNQEVIYQTQWFDERLTVFDRTTGVLVRELNAGPAPSHVMTRANNDLVHVAQNGSNYVREFNDLAGSGGLSPNAFIRDIPMGSGGTDVFTATHPHGHWMSSTGNKMVTPNENLNTSTVYNFPGGAIEATIPTGHVPIATGMMPDSSKYYVASFLDNTISVIDMGTNTEIKKINLIANYNPVTGVVVADPVSGKTFVGALPIQTPVSPDGTNMVTANTLTATITVVDTRPTVNGGPNPNEDTVVAMLPCDPGCHGVQYGAKAGGGYYVYVASKFGNAMIVVDPDPDGNGDPSDAAIVGRVLLAGSALVKQDDTVKGNKGMGGQGILPVPVVYNGWVQQWVQNCTTADCNTWKGQLTSAQKAPAPVQ
ncbi:MAG: copper oxidase [Nitrospirales bacterium]